MGTLQGKTTMVNCLAGLINPTHGNAYVMGKSIKEEATVLRNVMGMWYVYLRLLIGILYSSFA